MDGYKSGERCGLYKKIVAVTLLVLMSIAIAVTPIEFALGQDQNTGVTIIQLVPSGSGLNDGTIITTGSVGDLLNLQGTIYTANSTYQVTFANQIIASGTSQGYYVNSTFAIPEFPSGTYALILRDVAINVNSTEDDFQIQTTNTITAVPSQIPEGNSVTLNVAVTGGVPTVSYSANVSVTLPSPLNTFYSKIVQLGATSQKGTATAQVTFPDSSFQPSGSTTDYVGTYMAIFNQTASALTQSNSTFLVNFLDSTTYHRGQTVTINAVGYQPNQVATLTITSVSGGTALDSESVTASSDGNISKTWVVPSNAAIGNYTVTITPQGTAKSIADSQSFLVQGYAVSVKTVNLANEVVPGIQVQALDQATNIVYNGTTGNDGIANLNLEAGSFGLTAFLNGVNIGVSNITVSGDGSFSFQCQLTDLKIVVQNENGALLPYVNLSIAYQYKPANGGSVQTGNASGETDLSGAFVLNSTLIGISYTVDALMYNQVFNSGNNVFSNITAEPVSTIVVTCPNETLSINVVGNDQTAIPNTRVELVELTNGLFYSATTDSSGSTSSQVSFGMYRERFYKDNILINQTTVDVFGTTQQQVTCTLYGIQVTVKVVDFFGNPISNANVTLNGPETERFSAMTKGDGTAVFNNIVGGDMQVVAFAQGEQNNYQSMALTVNQPTSVQLKLGRYVALGSMLIPVSSLFALLVILVAIILLGIIEVYRRSRVKHAAGM